MSMTQPAQVLKTESLHEQLAELQAFVRTAAHEGLALHETERGLWQRLLQRQRSPAAV